MKRSNKKAFTIVELVIVIAVIAILAAVLIPTFVSLIRKSNVSNDTSLVRQLNEALAEDIDNEHNTLTDALAATETYGYIAPRLIAKARDNEILWDSVNDVFCYLNDGKIEYTPDSVKDSKKLAAGDYRLWKIYTTAPTVTDGVVQSDYSIYVASQAAADAIDGKIVNVGIDTGDYALAEVNYTNAGTAKSDVVIRTSSASTSLTINAAGDVVTHYGSVGSLNIIAVASTSYHENGTVAFAEIATGRIVLEKSSEVKQIHLTATEGSFNNITVAKAAEVQMPTFSRDSVEIPAEGKVVVALQASTKQDAAKDYVWLTAIGIYEQVAISSSATNAGTTYAADAGTAVQQEAAQQIANNITATIGTETYTIKAEKVGDEWTYALEGSTAEATAAVEAYTVTATATTVTVEDNGTPVAATTNVANGLTGDEKAAAKAEYVHEAVIEEVEEDDKYIARIDTTGYETLAAAVQAAQANNTIELFKNDPSTDNVSVDKRITINMNGNTFAGTIVVATANNTYVRVNGTANVDAVSRINTYYFPNLYMQRSGTVTLLKDHTRPQVYYTTNGQSGDFTVDLNGKTLTLSNNSSEGAVYVGCYYGTADSLTFRNGNIVTTGTSSSSNAFEVYGNLTLDNVNLTSACGTAIKGEAGYWDGPANVTISNSTITASQKGIELVSYKSGSTVRQSTLTVSNSDITAQGDAVKLNGSNATINDTNIESKNSKAVTTYASTSGGLAPAVTIGGTGTIKSGSGNTIDTHKGTLNITGTVDVIGSNTVVYADSSSIMIANGTYTGSISLGSSGQLTIAGGTFDGNVIQVTQNGRLLVIGETQYDELTNYTITGSNGTYEVVAQ